MSPRSPSITPEEYVATGGIQCPVCRSDDIVGGSVEINAGHAFQKVHCHDCEAAWVDTYALTGYSELELPV